VILVDTSVWIHFFRKRDPLRLLEVVSFDQIVTCLPVIQEVLQGFHDQLDFERAQSAMFSFPIVESPLSDGVYRQAVDLYRAARRAGITVRSSVDCLIAACAIRNHLELLHVDRDFAAIARVVPLKAREAARRA